MDFLHGTGAFVVGVGTAAVEFVGGVWNTIIGIF